MSRVHGIRDGMRYGALGLPLAFCALPLYVVMPHFYATHWGVSLTALGSLLLGLRLLDALVDPWIGRWCDAWAREGSERLWRAMVVAAAVLAAAFAALFHPLVDAPHALAWAGVSLALTYLAYSVVTVGHQSWGARLGGDARERSTVVAWREGLGLLGVVLATIIPALWSASALGWVMAPLLLLGLAALWGAPRPAAPPGMHAPPPQAVWQPWSNPAFVRLVAVFALNGIASAVPATLVLFFIEDRLQVPAHWQGVFLGLYFLSAALSMPLWLRVVARLGLPKAWLAGMGLSIAAFVGSAAVGAGDVAWYGAVCLASGLALGSDLAIPAALLAQVAQRSGRAGDDSAHGVYFGWWNLVTKLNLALAAGLTLPLLAALGYTPGSRAAAPLAMLTAVYCLLPCVLKALAGLVLYGFFVRPSERLVHAT